MKLNHKSTLRHKISPATLTERLSNMATDEALTSYSELLKDCLLPAVMINLHHVCARDDVSPERKPLRVGCSWSAQVISVAFRSLQREQLSGGERKRSA